MGRTKANISKTNCILEAGKIIYEPKEIANTFNTHFSAISCKLISQLPASAANHQDYLGSSNSSSMFFYPTCPQEIKRVISTLKPKLSSGWDGIPLFILKHLPKNVISILSYIFNQSLSQGKFIFCFKHTKVIPLFKKGCPKDVSNYRPISLLSCFSKIIEKLVYIRLYSFLNKFNLISENQFGFRRGHSTCHLTFLLTDQIQFNSVQSFFISATCRTK